MRVPPSDSDAAAASGQNTLPLSSSEQAQLAQAVMRRQGLLSLRVAAVFIVLLLGLPLVNLYAPNLAATPLFGFSLTWLFLGVLFYPITVLLSIYFVRHSDRIEAETAQAGRRPAASNASRGQEGSPQ